MHKVPEGIERIPNVVYSNHKPVCRERSEVKTQPNCQARRHKEGCAKQGIKVLKRTEVLKVTVSSGSG